jgi:hypothetical protein
VLPRIQRIFEGRPVEIRYCRNLSDTAGNPAHAATSIPGRVIVLDPALKKDPREHRRILLHEFFHFAWVRLGNPARWAWEACLKAEWRSRVRGEAGWSAEWRKQALSADDVARRSRRWREYCCESFCDTAAWITSQVDSENTLRVPERRARAAWFGDNLRNRPFPI